MGLLGEFVAGVWSILTESAPFLLLGFVLAGAIKVFLPGRAIASRLGSDGFGSVLRATLYGMPLPLCSCSVIPTAVALRRAGASKGATSSFLISTPETGVDSISITYALFDPLMTVVRPVAAFFTALLTGAGVNALVARGADGEATEPEPADASCCHGGSEASGEESGPTEDAWQAPGPLGSRLRRAVRYAFGPLLDDLTPSLVVGFLASALIALALPDRLFTEVLPSGWPAYLLMLVIGTPMYICAVASTPVAAALVAKGLDPGAALVFLLVGPATNVTTLLVVTRFLGKRILALYLVSIVVLALVAGALTSQAYAALGIDLAAETRAHLHGGSHLVPALTGALLALLIVWSAVRIRLLSGWARWLRGLVGGTAS